MPKAHLLRDTEGLTADHLELGEPKPSFTPGLAEYGQKHHIADPGETVKSMDRVKGHLLQQKCPDVPLGSIHSGYHRGRRPLWGSWYWPDIVSIHHIHLHVIVRPNFWLTIFKYPSWMPLMWKSDEAVIREVEELASKQN